MNRVLETGQGGRVIGLVAMEQTNGFTYFYLMSNFCRESDANGVVDGVGLLLAPCTKVYSDPADIPCVYFVDVACGGGRNGGDISGLRQGFGQVAPLSGDHGVKFGQRRAVVSDL